MKYTGDTNPGVWLEDYRLACRAGGASDDRLIIQYLPICLGENVHAWLDFLPADSIGSWADLRKVFIGNFQGTYVRPGNSWDLKNCKQEPDESLRLHPALLQVVQLTARRRRCRRHRRVPQWDTLQDPCSQTRVP